MLPWVPGRPEFSTSFNPTRYLISFVKGESHPKAMTPNTFYYTGGNVIVKFGEETAPVVASQHGLLLCLNDFMPFLSHNPTGSFSIVTPGVLDYTRTKNVQKERQEYFYNDPRRLVLAPEYRHLCSSPGVGIQQ